MCTSAKSRVFLGLLCLLLAGVAQYFILQRDSDDIKLVSCPDSLGEMLYIFEHKLFLMDSNILFI